MIVLDERDQLVINVICWNWNSMESVFDLLKGLAGSIVVNGPLRKKEHSLKVIVIHSLSVSRS